MDARVVIRPVWMPQAATDSGTILAELGPLFEAYWREVRPPGFGGFAFNVEGFVRAWMSRELILFEIRQNTRLSGFIFLLRRQSLFCRDAIEDISTVYLIPEARGHGLMGQAIAHVKDLARALDITHLYRSADAYVDGVHHVHREALPCP